MEGLERAGWTLPEGMGNAYGMLARERPPVVPPSPDAVPQLQRRLRRVERVLQRVCAQRAALDARRAPLQQLARWVGSESTHLAYERWCLEQRMSAGIPAAAVEEEDADGLPDPDVERPFYAKGMLDGCSTLEECRDHLRCALMAWCCAVGAWQAQPGGVGG